DLGDRADGRPGVPGSGLLVDGDGRRQALDEVDVWLLHLAEELPGIGRQGLHVPPLALGVDGVEGQRALAGARDAREHDELPPGKVEGDVLQVVLTGTVNDEPLSGTHNDVILEAGVKRSRQRLSTPRNWRFPRPGTPRQRKRRRQPRASG